MSTNNHHNSRCGFEELLVSYIYDEIDSPEKSDFEKHLDGCKTCIDEFSSFGLVRSSINDWRTFEFAELATPPISIPELETTPMRSFVTSKNRRSRFHWIGDIFSITPNWATATSIAAILAMVVGITFVILNFSNSPEVSKQNEVVIPVESKDLEKTISDKVPIDNIQLPENELADPNPDLVRETLPKTIENSKPSINVERNLPVDRTKKIETKKRQVNRPSETTIANKTDRLKQVQKSGQTPKLTNFEVEEDDSLRLADLFEEVGSK
jgi:hypothetical protein